MSGNLPNMIWFGQLQGTPRLERDWWWFDDVREWNLGTSWLFQPCKITWQSGIDDLHYELDVHCNHASRILIANIAHGLMSPSHANPVYHIRRRGSFFHAISSGPCQNFTLCNLEQSSESLDQHTQVEQQLSSIYVRQDSRRTSADPCTKWWTMHHVQHLHLWSSHTFPATIRFERALKFSLICEFLISNTLIQGS